MPDTTVFRGRWTVAAVWCVAAALLLPGRVAPGSGPDSSKPPASGSRAEPSYRPGTVIRDCDVCPELVVVPAGTFRMGDLAGGGDADEGPVRTVGIPRPFAVGRHEVTFAQWDACAAAGACRRGVGDLGFGRGERPVILVDRRMPGRTRRGCRG